MNIFEEATKQALRYPTARGELNTEQLWDLPLQSTRFGQLDLDTVAKNVNTLLKQRDGGSFVQRRSNPAKTKLSLMLEVIKAVIARKQEDAAAARNKAANDARRAVLNEALNNQQQKKLEGMDEAAILAELAALDDK